MRPHRFVGITIGEIDGEHIRRKGKAVRLFDYFVKRQTAPDGTVNYGRPLSYDRISQEIPNCPPRRTLQRWVARLRNEQYISAGVVRYGRTVQGIVVKILRPKKWAVQLSLFPAAPNVVPIKRSEDLTGGARSSRPSIAGSTPAPRSIAPNALEQKAVRLEREIRTLLESCVGSLELPAHAEQKIRDLARELELTRYAIREFEKRKAG